DLLPVGRVRDARPHRVPAFGAAIERRGADEVAGSAQARGHGLPDPAALVGAVDEDVGRHHAARLKCGITSFANQLSCSIITFCGVPMLLLMLTSSRPG